MRSPPRKRAQTAQFTHPLHDPTPPRQTTAITMASADPFANPPWEGGNTARLPTHPAQSFQSSIAPSTDAEEKALEIGAPPYAAAAPTYIPPPPAAAATRPGLKERFDGVMSPNRRYMGRSRRTVLLGALGLLALLVLVLGLGLGLGLKKGGGDS